MSDFRRSRASGWILAVIAAVFGGISGLIVVSIARIDAGELLYPGFIALWGAPLLLGLGVGAVAWRHLTRQPVLLTLDAQAVRVGAKPPLPWGDVAEIVHRSVLLGYGPREQLVFRRRRAPTDIAAQRADAAMHALFTDISIRPADIDRSVEELLAEIDRALAEAGLKRGAPGPRRFRGAWVSRRWPVRSA